MGYTRLAYSAVSGFGARNSPMCIPLLSGTHLLFVSTLRLFAFVSRTCRLSMDCVHLPFSRSAEKKILARLKDRAELALYCEVNTRFVTAETALGGLFN